MSANASTLENVADNVAQGVADVINADAPNSVLPAFGPRSTSALSKGRVEVAGASFSRATDQMNYAPGGAPYYNHRRGFITITVITQRAAQTSLGKDTKQGIQIGRCRWLMSKTAQKLIPSVVGGYEILDIIDLGDSYISDDATQTDRTALRFQIDLVIPPANYSDT